jgi:hypothetical protein
MLNRIIIIIFTGLFLSACNSMNEQIDFTGKYRNTFEPEATHYVELKADSTFFHYYKNGDEPALENKGYWRTSVRPQKTEIIFDTWVDFGYKDEAACNGCLRAVKIENSELIFNVDLPSEMNFKKEE